MSRNRIQCNSQEWEEEQKAKQKRKPPEKTARWVDALEKRKGMGNPNWHGGKAKIQCIECRREFFVIPSRKEKAKCCSLVCWNEFQRKFPMEPPNKGVKNPNKKGETIISKACRECGSDFKIPIRMRNLKSFCGSECRSISRKRRRGDLHPGFKNATLHTCQECGADFRARGKRKYCSVKCSKPPLAKARLNDGIPRLTPEHTRIRASDEYSQWRTAVFTRDGFKCKKCNAGGRLTAHHIKRFSTHPELRLFVPNGVTLCEKCHLAVRNKEEKMEKEFSAMVETLL